MADGTPIIIKKKKIIAGGHHGGSWKVAYADFVTAMMAFFMVMWIMGMDASTRSMVQGYFNDPLGFTKTPPQSNNPFPVPGAAEPKPGGFSGAKDTSGTNKVVAEAKEIGDEIKREILKSASLKELSKFVDIAVDDEGLRIELTESKGSVFFESGRDVIRPDGLVLIKKIAPILGHSGRRLIVEGHTDRAPYPGHGYTNWELSTDRAAAMRRSLSKYGVAYRQFAEVRGLADTILKDSANPYSGLNRRVTILIPFVKTQDGGLNFMDEAGDFDPSGVIDNPVDIDKAFDAGRPNSSLGVRH